MSLPTREQILMLSRKRYSKHAIKDPTAKKEDYESIFLLSLSNGFKCGYCNVQLLIKSNPPYLESASVDHKMPLSMGGSSRKENLLVCCHACNLIKGTLTDSTYKQLLERIVVGSELFNKLFIESFNGKFANKLERENER